MSTPRARRRGQPRLHPRRLRGDRLLYAYEECFLEAFRTGCGIGWHEHDRQLFRGTERFCRPGYRQHLTSEWIPALHGVEEKLTRGATVADVGCGHGATTIIMAQAFPNSTFHGYVAGTVTNYSSDQPGCSGQAYAAGSGFIDPGGGDVHTLINSATAPAETIAIQILPEDAPRKTPEPVPANCQ